MSEKLSRSMVATSVILGTAAGLSLHSFTQETPVDAVLPQHIVNYPATSVYADHARDSIAQLYDSCKLVKVEPTTAKDYRYQSPVYEALKLTVDLDVSDSAIKYREQYKDDDTVTWDGYPGSQNIRLAQYKRDESGLYGPRELTYRFADVATESGRTSIDIYPSRTTPDGTLFVAYVGNTAATIAGEVTAGTPCGAVELDVTGNTRTWSIAESPVTAPLPLEPSDYIR